MRVSHHLLTALIASAILSACSNAATPQGICNGVAVPAPPMILIYPAPNATGVPDGSFTLVLGAPVQTGLRLNGAGPLTSVAVPNPLPTPYATPSPTPSEYSGYAVGPLSAATTYTLTETLSPGTVCQFTETLGQFTTR